MGNKFCPYSVATGEENYHFFPPNFKPIRKDKIDYDTIMDGMYPYKRGKFEELEFYKIHSNYD